MDRRTIILPIVFEFIGSAIFIYGICASTSDNSAFMIPLSLFIAIKIGATISGANYNPAVTLACMLKRNGRTPWVKGVFYWIAQILGSISGAALNALVANQIKSVDLTATTAIPQGYLGETLGTFIFVLIILLHVHDDTKTSSDNAFNAFIIALALYVGRAFTEVTGGCLNPAVAIGLNIFKAISSNSASPLANTWLYILAPFTGAALAVVFFEYLFRPTHRRYSIAAEDND